MNILKLAEHYNPPSERVADHPAPTVPDLQTQQAEAIPVAPQYVGDIDLKALLDFVDRREIGTSGEHNNCGFNAILAQVGDHTNGDGMVNLLRHRLKYGDESSNEMFDTHSCLEVAILFNRPVVEVCYNSGKIAQLSFSIPIPTDDLSIHFRGDTLLTQNFVGWCVSCEWSQERIDTLSQWLAANVPGIVNFNEATPYDIALQLLKYPRTIALVSVDKGGHFNAAPHKDLQQEDSVLEFLRSSGDSDGAAD
ncbi:MAG: hypothetical protein LBJ75_00865 [Puniceicoccales bacterium]|jgi:hypothetical protein|nr:hypothetical protein [Puniceicoccales bacterium]